MGWAVGRDSDHDRWMGYGVPAYCDAACGTEIDRGLGWRCRCGQHASDDPLSAPMLYVCSDHTCADVDEDDLPPEHPDWTRHLKTDESWSKWRSENPDEVAALEGT